MQKSQRDVNFATKKLRRWAFTWCNYTEVDVEYLQNIPADKADYVIFGFELTQEDVPHLQGYVEFSVPLSGQAAKARLDPVNKAKSKVSLDMAYKGREANIEYCKKFDSTDPDAVELYGEKWFEVTNKVRQQGARTDWHNMHDLIKEGKTFTEFAQVYPEAAIKYGAGVERLISAFEEERGKAEFCAEYLGAPLRPWQQRIADELQFEAKGRKIIWAYETVGNVGKSWFSSWLTANMNAASFENGSTRDLAYMYKGQPIITFDFSRTSEERINYDLIERFLKGKIDSTKYAGRTKYFKKPHVVCFANWLPKFGAVSSDRWSIRQIRDGELIEEQMPEPFVNEHDQSLLPVEDVEDDIDLSDNFLDNILENVVEEVNNCKQVPLNCVAAPLVGELTRNTSPASGPQDALCLRPEVIGLVQLFDEIEELEKKADEAKQIDNIDLAIELYAKSAMLEQQVEETVDSMCELMKCTHLDVDEVIWPDDFEESLKDTEN